MWWQWEPDRESALTVFGTHYTLTLYSDPITSQFSGASHACIMAVRSAKWHMYKQAHQLRLSTVLLLPKQHQKLSSLSSFCLKQYFQSKFHVWKSFSMNLVHNFNPFAQFDTILCAWPKNYGHICRLCRCYNISVVLSLLLFRSTCQFPLFY